MPTLSGAVSRIFLFLKAVRYGRHEEILPEFLLTVKKQNLENLRRNHYAPIRHGSPCVTYETKVRRSQGAKRCVPSKATFPIMRSRP